MYSIITLPTCCAVGGRLDIASIKLPRNGLQVGEGAANQALELEIWHLFGCRGQ